MHYILFGLLYLFSLLPFFIIYAVSDFVSFLLFRIFKYRLGVILTNLNIAFPDKSKKEKLDIARRFYTNLTDTFLETIKLISMSEKTLAKRIQVEFSESDKLFNSGKDILFLSGHQMNWEYAHYAFAKNFGNSWVGIYMKINNKTVDRIFYKIRNKYNCVLIAAQDFKAQRHIIYDKKNALALIADQNPGWPKYSNWLNFFGIPAPFITGPEKDAHLRNPAVVFVNFVKLKRGFYKFSESLIAQNGTDLKNGQLTLTYRNLLEQAIQEQPPNYLWSHKRWKWTYDESLASKWIDNVPPPVATQPVSYP